MQSNLRVPGPAGKGRELQELQYFSTDMRYAANQSDLSLKPWQRHDSVSVHSYPKKKITLQNMVIFNLEQFPAQFHHAAWKMVDLAR